MGPKGWLKSASRRPSHIRSRAWPTSSSDGVWRTFQSEASEMERCSFTTRKSEKPRAGLWHEAQETLPVSPCLPSVSPVPSLSASSSFPEKAGSMKNFLPKAAAAALSAKRLVTSAPGAGSDAGDSAASAALSAAVSTGAGSVSTGAVPP